VESYGQTLEAAEMAKAAGATMLRGGAFKPSGSSGDFPGLGEEALKILADTRQTTGLPFVTEIIDPRDAEVAAAYADMLQIGARNMRNSALLHAAADSGLPVLLKRGADATIEEWLMAAESIAARGNLDIVLCERGIRTFEPLTATTLDLSAVPVVQSLSNLPVIVDPTHAPGRRDLVLPLSRAAMAVGADGILVDVHPDPDAALCDGLQALAGSEVRELASAMRRIPPIVGRSVATTVPKPREHGESSVAHQVAE
jgi:3-deoxy-7-phosphoheptulonate synthase